MSQAQEALAWGGLQEAIDYTPEADVAAGKVIAFGANLERLFAVARSPITAGRQGSLTIGGLFKFRKKANSEFSVGERIGWDFGNGEAVEAGDAALDAYAGVCTFAAGASDDFVIGKLNAGQGSESST